MKPVVRYRFTENGDTSDTKPDHMMHIQTAHKLLAEVVQHKTTFDLDQFRRTITLSDGTKITAFASIGFTNIHIDVPKKEEREEEAPKPVENIPFSAPEPNEVQDEERVNKRKDKYEIDYTVWVATGPNNWASPIVMRKWSPSKGLYGDGVTLEKNTVCVLAYKGYFWAINSYPENEISRYKIATGAKEVVASFGGNFAMAGTATPVKDGVLFCHTSDGYDKLQFTKIGVDGTVKYNAGHTALDAGVGKCLSIANDGEFAYVGVQMDYGYSGKFLVVRVDTGEVAGHYDHGGESCFGLVNDRLVGGFVRIAGPFESEYFNYGTGYHSFSEIDKTGNASTIKDGYMYPWQDAYKPAAWLTAVTKVGASKAMLVSQNRALVVDVGSMKVLDQWQIDAFELAYFTYRDSSGAPSINQLGFTPSITYCSTSDPTDGALSLFHVQHASNIVLFDNNIDNPAVGADYLTSLLAINANSGEMSVYPLDGPTNGYVFEVKIPDPALVAADEEEQPEEWETLAGTNSAAVIYNPWA